MNADTNDECTVPSPGPDLARRKGLKSAAVLAAGASLGLLAAGNASAARAGQTSIDGVERTTVATGLDYPALVRAFESQVGPWGPTISQQLIDENASWQAVEDLIEHLSRPHGLLVIEKINQGALTSLEGALQQCALYIVGDPVTAQQILAVDIRASFLVPFRVAIYHDGSPNGATLTYERPSSLLATLGRPELAGIGRGLDAKIDAVVAAVLASGSGS